MKQGCRVTPGGGNPRESATEKRLPPFAGEKVKRWGKSPPRTGQPGRHGRPHREQCQIGASRGAGPGNRIPPQGRFSPRGPGWQLDPIRKDGARGVVIQRGNPWTESGLQAIRAFFAPMQGALPPRPFRAHPRSIFAKMKSFALHFGTNTPRRATNGAGWRGTRQRRDKSLRRQARIWFTGRPFRC